ncbi:MAG: ABC transporter ATP-binding protein [Desulfovibrionaceae bacterium]|nr:ABC transporter ATP-binding protein [Desulfovibrionaceae bacterium]
MSASVEFSEKTGNATATAAGAGAFAKPRPEDAFLLVDNVSMRFGGVTAVNELEMAIPRGGIVGLIGPNGAGKTTAFNVISGFYKPQEGRVVFNGRDVTGLPPHRICAAGMARTFQNIRLSHNMSALENVMVGCQVRRKYPWWMAPLGLPMFTREEQRIHDKAMALIERLSLVQYMHEKASSLPYGAQRRLEIARALATEPSFLLLDEPAAGMNPQESVELMHFIGHIRDEFDLTILLIEHDMKVVMGVCRYIWVMEYGALIAEGEPAAIRSNPEVIKAYLGEDMVQQHA